MAFYRPDDISPRSLVNNWYATYSELGNVADNLNEKTRWVFPYEVGNTYLENDMVLDDGWTMIANKDTSERASPQPLGVSNWVVDPDAPGWLEEEPLGTMVVSGNIFTSSIDGYVSGYRVYIPEIGYQTYYRGAISITYPGRDPQEEVSETFQPTSVGWIEINSSTRIIPAGTVVEVVLEHENRASTITEVASWNYTSSNQDAVVLSGEAHRRLSRTYVDFNKVPATPFVPGTLDLDDVVAGTHITTALSDWTVVGISDLGDYYRFEITGSGDPINGLVEFTFIIPSADVPQPYWENVGYWAANPPAGGTGEGFLSLDGAPNTGALNAYGTDILVQPAVISEDWDVVAASSTLPSAGQATVALQTALQSESIIDQNPIDNTGTPLQILFGADQTTDYFHISAAGAITCLATGEYTLRAKFTVGREGTVSESQLYTRLMIDSGSGPVQQGPSSHTIIDNPRIEIPFDFEANGILNEGEIMTFQMARDLDGDDSGGLRAGIPDLVGWNPSASARIIISRFQTGSA
jgi:hypothetical protein